MHVTQSPFGVLHLHISTLNRNGDYLSVVRHWGWIGSRFALPPSIRFLGVISIIPTRSSTLCIRCCDVLVILENMAILKSLTSVLEY